MLNNASKRNCTIPEYTLVLLGGLLAMLCYLSASVNPVRPAFGSTLHSGNVRVCLTGKASEITFSVNRSYRLIDLFSGQLLGTIGPGGQYTISVSGYPYGLSLSKNGQTLGTYTALALQKDNSPKMETAVSGASGLPCAPAR